ncbi:MAG: hypothetical protein ACREFB_01860, partial [Stellaceae bacterium]
MGEIFITEIALEHRKELGHALRREFAGLRIGDVPQLSQQAEHRRHQFDPVPQHRIGIPDEEGAEIVLLLYFHRFCGNGVKRADNGRVFKAIAQHRLPVADRFEIAGDAAQERPARDCEHVVVALRHRFEQCGQREIGGQRFCIPGKTVRRVVRTLFDASSASQGFPNR